MHPEIDCNSVELDPVDNISLCRLGDCNARFALKRSIITASNSFIKAPSAQLIHERTVLYPWLSMMSQICLDRFLDVRVRSIVKEDKI